MSEWRALILDGDPEEGGPVALAARRIEGALAERGRVVRLLSLRDMGLKPCSGCFGCWVKTPGECIIPDGGAGLLEAAAAADFILLASPLVAGFPSALVKRALDRMIPLLHPYGELVGGELHHRARYAKYPRFGLLLQPRKDDAREDLEVAALIHARTALNFKSSLSFARRADDPAPDIVAGMLDPDARPLPAVAPAGPGRAPRAAIVAPSSLLVVNGSPRGRTGNSELLLDRLSKGFASAQGRRAETLRLAVPSDAARAAGRVSRAECAIVGFPLYTDSMPSIVKAFFEELDAAKGKGAMPALGFIVQCGFPGAAHIRPLERYLERFAARLGAPYLGTVARGNAEGLRLMPASMTARLFGWVEDLGRSLALDGAMDESLVSKVSGPERLSAPMKLMLALLSRTRLDNRHWDLLMEENGALGRSFARPYEPRTGELSARDGRTAPAV